jgi:hypothetical protein
MVHEQLIFIFQVSTKLVSTHHHEPDIFTENYKRGKAVGIPGPMTLPLTNKPDSDLN